ncbi:hypothetical protein FGO68_gene16686 [Halteria grandinella]|uniref:Uncharacterized protein n=1 Tax=Halteria grandinella TaxID=5974 RepID=A0A8J8NPK8_HALGN|nr:hypothetical protein FGO68_gene16686 [Halteria grandinella]
MLHNQCIRKYLQLNPVFQNSLGSAHLAVATAKCMYTRRATLSTRQILTMGLMLALLFFCEMPLSAEARGKKKKKKSGGGGAQEAVCLDDCSATCCLSGDCADTKIDCAQKFKRPFDELYTGFASIFCITMGVSVFIGLVNFCLRYKFCQHYDENLDSYVGGFSICDAISCLITCGLIFRKKKDDGGPSADELDFRKRFEKSMDKHSGDLGFGEVKKKRQKERKGKSMANYLSTNAKTKSQLGKSRVGGMSTSMDGEFDGSPSDDHRPKRSKCHEFCCIVFCCMDANIYYGEERYARMVAKAQQDKPKVGADEYDDTGRPVTSNANQYAISGEDVVYADLEDPRGPVPVPVNDPLPEVDGGKNHFFAEEMLQLKIQHRRNEIDEEEMPM